MIASKHRRAASAAAWVGWAALAAACTPALNWRDTLIGESGVMSLFPCHPDVLTRKVRLAGGTVDMTLRSCPAAGLQFGIADAELADARAAAVAVGELRQLAGANIGAASAVAGPISIKGLDPGASAVALRLSGRRNGQSEVQERVVLLVVGAHVVQVSVVGDRIDEDAADTFFAGLNVPH